MRTFTLILVGAILFYVVGIVLTAICAAATAFMAALGSVGTLVLFVVIGTTTMALCTRTLFS